MIHCVACKCDILKGFIWNGRLSCVSRLVMLFRVTISPTMAACQIRGAAAGMTSENWLHLPCWVRSKEHLLDTVVLLGFCYRPESFIWIRRAVDLYRSLLMWFPSACISLSYEQSLSLSLSPYLSFSSASFATCFLFWLWFCLTSPGPLSSGS